MANSQMIGSKFDVAKSIEKEYSLLAWSPVRAWENSKEGSLRILHDMV